jgi:hypothetical protein
VGENRDNDEENNRGHAGKPQERQCGNACLRGRHRPSPCMDHPPFVKGEVQKRTKPLTVRLRALGWWDMKRAPKFSFVVISAPFHLR